MLLLSQPGRDVKQDVRGTKFKSTPVDIMSGVVYGWMPHNASFGFLDLTPAALGQIHF
jgi:hypothetical protein